MKDKLTASEKKVLTYWGILAAIVFIIALVLGFIALGKKYKEDRDLIKEYKIVYDQNRYATVNTAINKYYAFLNSGDKEAALKILSTKFKDKNKITEKNVDKYVSFEQGLNYNSRVMCHKNLSKNQMTYLVSGFESNKFTGERLEKKYYQVILDSDNFHFSVTPISVKDYKGECYE